MADAKQRYMLVETMGDFMFTDVTAAQDIQNERPSVVKPSTFIEQKIASTQIKVLETDWTGGTDAEFMDKWNADPKSAYAKSAKVDAAVAAKKDKQARQIKMNELRPTGATPIVQPVTAKPESSTFDSRVIGSEREKNK